MLSECLNIWPKIENGRLFSFEGYHSGAISRVASQSSFYDGQSDPSEICS